ncbi:TPA: hypothetical protein ACNH8R_006052 [Pseudomonas aeruginosa]
MTKANECTCPSGDGSLRHPCPAHPASVELAGVAANLTFINGRPAMCGCQVEYSSGGGEYSDVIYVTLCAKHSGSAILDLVATNRIALTPEYEGQWHADLYLDREIPLAKAEGATPAEAVLALMSAERIDPEQESVEQAGGNERAAFELFVRKHCGMPEHIAVNWDAKFTNDAWEGWKARAALAQPSSANCETEWSRFDPFFVVDHIRRNTIFDADLVGRMLDFAIKNGPSAQPSPAQAEQAEAERPIVSFEKYMQVMYDRDENAKRLDAALARVAELAQALRHLLHNIKASGKRIDLGLAKECAEDALARIDSATPAQAQHSVPEGWMLVECGIWTQEQVDEMQKTVARFRNSEFVDDRALAMAVADAGQCKAPEISLAELLAAAPGKEVPQAWLEVQAERKRQVEVEGYHGFRDSHYINYELSKAARAYIEVSWHALSGGLPCKKPESWPWMAGFKWADGRTMLVKAGALILAEIERLDRAAAPGKEVGHE